MAQLQTPAVRAQGGRIGTSLLSTLFIGLLALVSSAVARAQSGAVKAEVLESVHSDVSPRLSDVIRTGSPGARRVLPIRKRPFTPRPFENDPVIQTSPGARLGATRGISFEGLGNATMSITSTPPDTDGAIGDTQYVQWVNDSFAVFDKKTGATLLGPVLGNSLWSGFGTACETDNDGDPVVLWDKAAHRWALTQFAVTGGPPYLQCFAISTTNDATGTYFRYAYQFPNFNDYGKMSVWPDAYYIAFNMFQPNNGPFVGAKVCAIDRAKMLAGAAATAQCFPENASAFGFLPSDADGATPPPAGAPSYFLDMGTNSLNLYKFHVDFSNINNTTFTGPVNIAVAAYNEACNGGGNCIPQPNGSQQLESGGDRLMFRLAYRNFGSHESLVVNHAVDIGGGKTALRWYELRNPAGVPTVFQQGSFAPDGNSRWMGSIAMDKSGDIGVGYSVSSSTVHPGIGITGRLATDPLGTLQSELSVVNGGGSQIGIARWGDYSAMTVDPVDDCTFWYTQEYMQFDGSFNWYTHINSFKFAGCGSTGPIAMLSPTSLAFGNQAVGSASASKTLTLTNTGGATLNIASVHFGGANPADFTGTNGCGATLAGGAHCNFTVAFKPTVTGSRTATLAITDNAPGSPQTVTLSGTGVAAGGSLSVTPGSLAFGSQKVGTVSAAQTVTVKNVSSATVTFTGITLVGDVVLPGKTCGVSLAAGASCTLSVAFEPTATGARTASLSITDSGTGSPQTVTVSGTGS